MSGKYLFVYVAVVVGVLGLLMAMLSVGTKLSNDEIARETQLINPPQEVLDGRVKNVTITTVYNLKDNTGTQTMTLALCSSETWTVPANQINTVSKWLKSGLAPNKGCD